MGHPDARTMPLEEFSMRHSTIPSSFLVGLMLSFPLASRAARAQTPGVDIAAPRVAVSTVTDALVFSTANLVVEQTDYVMWQYAGTITAHTTTSGGICGSTTGLWDAPLNSTSKQCTRQFSDTPQVIPYHCTPHCPSGMRGQVTVTGLITATAADVSGTLNLSWSGGSGLYRVFRGVDARFPNTSGTVVLTPAGGTTATSLTDTDLPSVGGANFYLVM